MEKTINQIKAAAAAALGLLTGLWGWFGWLVVGWIGCMALDYLTGSMAAAKAGDWSSGKAREGIWHKCGMIVAVVVAAGADLLLSVVLACRWWSCRCSTPGWCARWCWCGTS